MDSAHHPPIELDDSRGHCPTCDRPILTHATGRCSFCGASVEARIAESPEAQARIAAMAPGWDVDRLKGWLRARPALLARVMEQEAWPCLGAWVAEPLWREWESRESHRRANGQEMRIGGVVLQQVSLAALGDASPWIACRIIGRRSAFVVDRATGMVVSGNRGAKLFTEAWKLEATGQPEPKPLLNCHSCGAPMAPKDLRCGYCRAWQVAPPEPWRLIALQDLMPKALEELPPLEAQHHNPFENLLGQREDWGDSLFDGIMNNFIC